MRDNWIPNYKRHYYFQQLNEFQQIVLQVNDVDIRFTLKLIDYNKNNTFIIAQSNEMQLLKDLIIDIQYGMSEDEINNKYNTLQYCNIQYLYK